MTIRAARPNAPEPFAISVSTVQTLAVGKLSVIAWIIALHSPIIISTTNSEQFISKKTAPILGNNCLISNSSNPNVEADIT